MRVQTHELQVQLDELRVPIHELLVQIYELWFQIHELQVQIHKLRVQIHELLVQICKLRVQIYEFTSSDLQVTSSNLRVIKSMKTEVSSLKSSWFLKIVSPKLFGNSWGKSYIQFQEKISCFTFSRLHGYSFSKNERVNITCERRDLNFPQKSYPPAGDFGESYFFLCF